MGKKWAPDVHHFSEELNQRKNMLLRADLNNGFLVPGIKKWGVMIPTYLHGYTHT